MKCYRRYNLSNVQNIRVLQSVIANAQADHFVQPKPLKEPTEVYLNELLNRLIKLELQNDTFSQSLKIMGKSRDHYFSLHDLAPVGYLTITFEGLIDEINLKGCSLLGEARQQLLQQHFSSFVTKEALERWHYYFFNELKNNKHLCFELQLQRKDGTHFSAQLDCQNSSKLGGKNVMLVAMTDITVRKMTEVNLALQSEAGERQLIASLEDIRRRLTNEFHGRTSPNLAAINLNLEVISGKLHHVNSPDFVNILDDTRALIADTVASLGDICADMNPPVLDYAGLAAVLESYSQQFSHRTGIKIQFDCENRNELYKSDLESLIFRIFQEALDCAKHSHAIFAGVTLSCCSGHPITLNITYDGCSFTSAQMEETAHLSLAVLNMQEMAALASGKLTIESNLGSGTCITLEVP